MASAMDGTERILYYTSELGSCYNVLTTTPNLYSPQSFVDASLNTVTAVQLSGSQSLEVVAHLPDT